MSTEPAELEGEVFFNLVIEKCPANKFRWTKTKILTLEQVMFLSYGIEPADELDNRFLLHNFERFVEVDFLFILKLSRNAVEAGILPLYDRLLLSGRQIIRFRLKLIVFTSHLFKKFRKLWKETRRIAEPGRKLCGKKYSA